MADNADTGSQESLTDSLKQLASDLGVILRDDLASAKAEMVEKAKEAGMGAGMLSGSVLTAFLALFSVTVLAMIVLSAALKPWLAALIVTLFWAIATAILALSAKRRLQHAGPPVPEHAIADIKADFQTAKDQVGERQR